MRTTKLFLLIFIAVTGIVAAKTVLSTSGKTKTVQAISKAPAQPLKPTVNPQNNISYDSTLQMARYLKNNLAAKLNHTILTDEAAAKAAGLFTDILNNYLVTPWIGTPWDFNGVTQQPGKGQIACGYFVTTLLSDAGVQLNRVKLAQCASGKIISSLVQPANHKNYSALSFNDFITEIKKKGKGVFIVGLDFHTGFLLNDGSELYFIHSNYIGRKGVVKEVALESQALSYSKWRSTGWLTNDKVFLGKWLNG